MNKKEDYIQTMEQICKDRKEQTKVLSNIEIAQKLMVMGDIFKKAKDNKELFEKLVYLNFLLASELYVRLLAEADENKELENKGEVNES